MVYNILHCYTVLLYLIVTIYIDFCVFTKICNTRLTRTLHLLMSYPVYATKSLYANLQYGVNYFINSKITLNPE